VSLFAEPQDCYFFFFAIHFYVLGQCLSNGGPRTPGGLHDYLIALFYSNEKECEMS
jgi:hypothetical protein